MNGGRKYIFFIGDGMADEPVAELGNRTPLEAASTPNMDWLASHGVMGSAKTIPDGIAPGSDTANLSIFGYNPRRYFTGRAPLEAINMGIELGADDAAFRCNIVTIDNGIMADFTADHIDTALSRVIMEEMQKAGLDGQIEFQPGVSYRNILIWRNYPYKGMPHTTPPHDITGRSIEHYLPKGEGSDVLLSIMQRSADIIARSSAVADARLSLKGNPVQVWLWGGGKRPAIEPITERYGLKGCTISAVDLIHGIGRVAGLSPKHVDGVTGYLDTNYGGKAAAAVEALSSGDNFVFLHVEAPDESGHEGSLSHKLKAIEDFDSRVVGPVLEGLKAFDDYVVLLMPDHPTPLSTKTHSSEPVPFVIYGSRGFPEPSGYTKAGHYSEKDARTTGLFIDDASTLMGSIMKGSF